MGEKNPSKTNALRLLENSSVNFVPFAYDVSDGAIDAKAIAIKLSVPTERIFKTLVVATPERKAYFVFIVPGSAELDLKRGAKVAQVKALEMIHQKELLPLTGYVHGGCSPIGMKKHFPSFIDETALCFERIWVSGGMVGLNLAMAPEDLAGFIEASFENIAR